MKRNKMNSSVSINTVKTPMTVSDFRENLSKYFMTIGNGEIYVRDNDGIEINKLNRLSDLYDILKCSEIFVVPLLDIKDENIIEHMNKTKQVVTCNGFFDEDSNFELFDNQNLFRSEVKNIKWVRIDSQIYREFFVKSLGKFL